MELERRKAHIEGLPGTRLKNDLEALNRCSYIIGENGKELERHVARFLNSQRHVNQLSDQYVNELVRFLHNYLTSVTSLIDAQRVVMRHRWPSDTKGVYSKFETGDYDKHRREIFETGESEFMVKLRNYCTHYAIPVPGLGTTMSWQHGGPVLQVNTLQLDRDRLLDWDKWGAPAKAYLERQNSEFDLSPIIERYMKSVRRFYEWFWTELNDQSKDIKDELHSKSTELMGWYLENDLQPDWLTSGGEPPADWNGRKFRAARRQERYAQGTRGYHPVIVGPDRQAIYDKEAAGAWPQFPR